MAFCPGCSCCEPSYSRCRKATPLSIWNTRVGKDKNKSNFGLIWCTKCGRQWPWKDRGSNMSRTVRAPTSVKPCPPDWVQNLPHCQSTISNIVSTNISHTQPLSRPTRRIRGKQSIPPNSSSSNALPNVSGAASSSSGIQFRHGIG